MAFSFDVHPTKTTMSMGERLKLQERVKTVMTIKSIQIQTRIDGKLQQKGRLELATGTTPASAIQHLTLNNKYITRINYKKKLKHSYYQKTRKFFVIATVSLVDRKRGKLTCNLLNITITYSMCN